MNSTILTGKWRQTKGAVQEKWGELTEDDFQMLLGEKEQLAGRLQERYGYTQERAQQEVTAFIRSLRGEESTLAEMRDKSVEAIQENSLFTATLIAAISLLVSGYILNRFFAGKFSI